MNAQICKHMVIAEGRHTCLISKTVMNARYAVVSPGGDKSCNRVARYSRDNFTVEITSE